MGQVKKLVRATLRGSLKYKHFDENTLKEDKYSLLSRENVYMCVYTHTHKKTKEFQEKYKLLYSNANGTKKVVRLVVGRDFTNFIAKVKRIWDKIISINLKKEM